MIRFVHVSVKLFIRSEPVKIQLVPPNLFDNSLDDFLHLYTPTAKSTSCAFILDIRLSARPSDSRIESDAYSPMTFCFTEAKTSASVKWHWLNAVRKCNALVKELAMEES